MRRVRHAPASIPVTAQATTDVRSLGRREDQRFVTGLGCFQDDEPVSGDLYGAVLRSPHAHAAIVSIDVAAARARPGVRVTLTAADLTDLADLPCSLAVKGEGPLVVPPRPPLARERVRHVGDPVAFVVAETLEAARQACELIEIEYDILPSVSELSTAAEPGAPTIWPQATDNIALRYQLGDGEAVTAAFERAAHVVTCRLVNNRIVAAALEPRAALGRFDPETGRYRLSLSGASVHDIRRELALVLSIQPDRLDVVCPDGGALADADLLDDVGSGRLTPDEAQTTRPLLRSARSYSPRSSWRPRSKGAPRRCRRHPPPSTDPPPCRDRLIDTLAGAPHEASSLAVGIKRR